ncbi:MAG: four-carbon acid sugar kinase family protein, partial [Opitutaceae bacterium]
LPPAAAAARVAATLAHAAAHGARLVFKKIDSTLRGPVAAELAAVRRQFPGHRLLFCPANPAAGRTVEHGQLLVRGVPVLATEFARDPAAPVRDGNLPRIAGAQAGLLLPDVRDERELEAAVAAVAAPPGPWLAVGSGALAGPVARRLGGNAGALPPLPQPAPGPVLFLGGSAHPLNRTQAARLAATHGLSVIGLDPEHPARAIGAGAAELRRGGATIVLAPEARGRPEFIRDAMAAIGTALIGEHGVRRVFVTGGETARALAARLGVRELIVAGSIEPGLVLAAAATPATGPLLLAVKPGGFGDADTWLRAAAALGHSPGA